MYQYKIVAEIKELTIFENAKAVPFHGSRCGRNVIQSTDTGRCYVPAAILQVGRQLRVVRWYVRRAGPRRWHVLGWSLLLGRSATAPSFRDGLLHGCRELDTRRDVVDVLREVLRYVIPVSQLITAGACDPSFRRLTRHNQS